MTQFIDITTRDLIGAAAQWREHLTGTLGYDYEITVQVGTNNGKCELYLRADDKFQCPEGHSYSDNQVGRFSFLETASVDEDWDAICNRVWDRMKTAMPRDERELRAGMKMMGSIIEQAPSFKSAVGMMFAERIKAARDEATNYMIEHHGWKTEASA